MPSSSNKVKVILWAVAIVVSILAVYNIIVYFLNPSAAYAKAKPVAQYLEAHGAKKICEDDHRPLGDDGTPRYVAYFYMDKATISDQIIQNAAAGGGFAVTRIDQSYSDIWGQYKTAATEFTNRKGKPGSHEYLYGVNYDEINIASIYSGTISTCSNSTATATGDKLIIALRIYIYR